MSTDAVTNPATPTTTPVPAAGKPPQGGPFAFVGAFTGFYPAQASEFSHLDPVTRFLYAARSVILVISAQSALMAGLLAATDRRFEWLPFVAVFVGYLVLHAVSNLSNDYFGYRRGHDTADSPRRRYTLHPIASGAVTPRLLATGLVVLGLVSVAIAAYFVALRGLPALWLALIGGVLLYAYDAAPRALKELGLGEIAAFVVWGPLMIGGGYYVITGHWSGVAFAASVPPGLGVMSILVGKHVDQREFDTGQHQRTLPVLLGESVARYFNEVSVVAMYAVTVLLVALGDLTPFALLIVLAAPRALRAIRVMARPTPTSPPAGYVGWPLWYHRVCLVHNRAFGWLYVAGLVLGAIFPKVLIG
ncbi:prenyltransferase [uncultured Jatrophihabitans sp.]|uniref:prenyltransferase n=1 Tax=uncultured Jatrophihabitans sp. TaxID=1610747 RepID=UPI0035CA9B09